VSVQRWQPQGCTWHSRMGCDALVLGRGHCGGDFGAPQAPKRRRWCVWLQERTGVKIVTPEMRKQIEDLIDFACEATLHDHKWNQRNGELELERKLEEFFVRWELE
jgi:hypothetical protein